jgi:DNA-binding transcriptional MerR regulator
VLKQLGITRTTLYRWDAEGRLKPLPPKFPAKRRQARFYNPADVERLKQGQNPPSPDV